MTEDRHFYRPDEFAQRFQISVKSVYRLIGHKKLKAIIIGGVIRIPKKEYCRYCKAMNGCDPCTWSMS
jgi:excisionase family DNA binding protein